MSERPHVCPRCKGKGTVLDISPMFAVLTFGLSALIEASCPDECNICKGTGLYPPPKPNRR